ERRKAVQCGEGHLPDDTLPCHLRACSAGAVVFNELEEASAHERVARRLGEDLTARKNAIEPLELAAQLFLEETASLCHEAAEGVALLLLHPGSLPLHQHD